jgi:NDP-sugar pyrophosphorylase family protein
MKIVILLGGTGARFATVGYETPKPFLRVDGKTMLEHVVGMYPGDHEFIFVSNDQFVDRVADVLSRVPTPARVVPIPAHKLGPVHTLSYIWDELREDEDVMVSYCDFNAYWDFADFTKRVSVDGIHAAVPSYTGFHPHLIHKKKYAGIVADPNGKILNIQEKHSFTENPEDSFHSAGNYYFSKAGEMREYGKALIKNKEMLNGEYYLSMVYYHYLANNKNVLVYPLQHFLQWGTPEDLEEYEAWSHLINGKAKGITDIPESRRPFVKIPHAEESENYKKSFAYWNNYFSH